MRTETKKRKQAIVLLPLGPHGWASYADIVPELVKVWTILSFDLLPLYLPRPMLDDEALSRIKNANVPISLLGLEKNKCQKNR